MLKHYGGSNQSVGVNYIMADAILSDPKICNKCGLEKDGPRCKPCAKATTAAWREANPGRAAEMAAAWRKANPEEAKSRSAAYAKANADKRRQATKDWRLANPDRAKNANAAYKANNPEKIAAMLSAYRAANRGKLKAKMAEWYAANAERAKATSAAWRAANPEKVSEMVKDYYLANPEKCAAGRKAWRLANPDKNRVYSQNRRARKGGGKLSADLPEKLFAMQRGLCACCKKPLGKNYHLDHIMPLALGGSNTDDNMQLLTPRCNIQKSKKHPIDFMRSRGMLL